MVPGEDASVEGHCEGDRRPVVGVSWNPATSCLLKLLVGTSRDDLDTLDLGEVLNCFFEDVPSLSGDATPGLHDGRTPLQLMLDLAPLVLGRHELHLWVQDEVTPPVPQ